MNVKALFKPGKYSTIDLYCQSTETENFFSLKCMELQVCGYTWETKVGGEKKEKKKKDTPKTCH